MSYAQLYSDAKIAILEYVFLYCHVYSDLEFEFFHTTRRNKESVENTNKPPSNILQLKYKQTKKDWNTRSININKEYIKSTNWAIKMLQSGATTPLAQLS